MSCHPEDNLDIGLVPAVSEMVGEEAPRVVVVLVGKENAHAVLLCGSSRVVMSPDDAEKERACRSHDRDIWERPAAVVVCQRVDGLEEEWVAGNRAHGVVGDTSGQSATDPGRVGKEGVEAAIASLVSLAKIRVRVRQSRTSSKSM